MITINQYLDLVRKEFTNYLDSPGVTLCKLKDLSFAGGHLPDYCDLHIQQLYLLRYAYGYAFEYKRVLQHVLEQLGPKKHIFAISIGCGTCLDYWALTRVVPPECQISYHGIDLIDWNYSMLQWARPEDHVRSYKNDILRVYRRLNQQLESLKASDRAKGIEIQFFPKSICEFSLE